jgi:uncharacterized protein
VVALENMRRLMTQKLFAIVLLAALALPGTNAKGQISVTSGGGLTYSQNFDTLTRSTTAENWTDNTATTSVNDSPQVVGLVGWYAGSFGTTTTTPQMRAGTGSGTTGSFYSFGSSAASDRALGTLPSDSSASASMRLGARFVNNTAGTITGFNFLYDGEQWRNAGVTNINNQFIVAYAVFPANTGSIGAVGVFTTISSAEFNTPKDGTGSSTGALLDGNDAANRVAGLGGTITGLSVASGDEIWLRWFDANSPSADAGMAIDNFGITFEAASIPEPSLAALIGLGFLFLVRRARGRS